MTLQAFDEVIAEISLKHGVALSQDDPVLMLLTLQRHVAKETTAEFTAVLDQIKSELELSANLWEKNSLAKAERVISGSIAATSERLKEAGIAVGESLENRMQARENAFLSRLEEHVAQSRKVAMLNLCAACTTLIAVALLGLFALN
ncbi:MAG: hypothetical protein JHC61_00050 [Burkholderiaceae bacterium]|nr:hypothetical protein [Burkholderiaceae bacterium]MBJ7419251.1 hypothetical protein [Rhodoferax sp.]